MTEKSDKVKTDQPFPLAEINSNTKQPINLKP